MARIYFIYPNVYSMYEEGGLHHGIASISAVLKKGGHQTQLFCPTELSQIKVIFKELQSYKPDIVAFTSVSNQFKYVQMMASEIKKAFGSMNICGGVHATLVPECLEATDGLDAIVRGEGEYPLLELADAMDSSLERLDIQNFWFKKNGDIIRNEIRPLLDLDALPFEDREIFDYQRIIDAHEGKADFMFSRGCPFKCTYCCNHALSRLFQGKGRYYRFWSVEKALREIEEVTSKYRVKRLALGDDTFTANRPWFSEFLSEYMKRFKYPFKCQVKPGTATREMFQLLREAGCDTVMVGVESGNPQILTEVMKRGNTVEEIEETFRYANEAGLKTFAANIIGVPGENAETIKDTIRLNARINATYPSAGLFYPYIGTDLREYCGEKGVKIKDTSDKFVERRDVSIELPTLSKRELLYYAKNFRYLVHKEKSLKRALFYKLVEDPPLLLRIPKAIVKVLVPRRLRRKLLRAFE